MRQVIIWTNADPIHRCIYAAIEEGGGGGGWINLTTVEEKAWMSNYTLLIYISVITYPDSASVSGDLCE